MKKFNGVYCDYLRWYDSETGEIVKTKYDYPFRSEIEFSRVRLKTRQLDIVPETQDKVDANPFYINGVPSSGGRICFKTGGKQRLYISNRLIDFLYCSTNQPFKSCFRLDYAGYVSKSLVNMHSNPHIYVAYLTQEDMPNSSPIALEYDKTELVPKMQGRAFVYTDGCHFLVGRPYGKYGFEVRDALRRFFPNGLEEFVVSSDEFSRDILNFEQDNLKPSFDGIHVVHDRLDHCFDKGYLYDRKVKWTS